MGLAEIIALITGFFQFPKTILEFVKLLQKTPQERHQEIVARISKEADHFEKEGRPKWD